MIEFLMLVGGIWSLVSGEVPQWASGKKYRMTVAGKKPGEFILREDLPE